MYGRVRCSTADCHGAPLHTAVNHHSTPPKMLMMLHSTLLPPAALIIVLQYYHACCSTISVCKIPRIFECKVLLSALNSKTIFKCDLLLLDSVAKSVTQKCLVSETDTLILSPLSWCSTIHYLYQPQLSGPHHTLCVDASCPMVKDPSTSQLV